MNRTALVLILLLAVIVSARFIDAQTQPVAGLTSVAISAGPTGPPSLFANGSAGAPSISFTSDPTTGLYRGGSGIVAVALGGVPSFWITTGNINGRSNSIYSWTSSTDASLSADTGLARNAAGVVEVNNGTAGGVASLTTNNSGAAGGAVILGAASFSALNVNLPKGTMIYCVDCAPASAIDQNCVGSSTGSLAFRVNGLWKCIS